MKNGSYSAFYGDIPRRPLFLRFILETVAAGGIHVVRRATLFEEWARLKIMRDIVRPAEQGGQRLPIVGERSLGDAIELAFEAMAWAAGCMTRRGAGLVELTESCSASDILALPGLRNASGIEGLVLNSLLVPIGPRKAPEPVHVRFAHRTYQEYFLARFVLGHVEEFVELSLPPSVREWLDDLTARNGGQPSATPNTP